MYTVLEGDARLAAPFFSCELILSFLTQAITLGCFVMYFTCVGLAFNFVGVFFSFGSLRLGSYLSPLDAFTQVIKQVGASPALYQTQPFDAFGEDIKQVGACTALYQAQWLSRGYLSTLEIVMPLLCHLFYIKR